jgi:formate-dependent phosphoribosylglycinamide formyltransferase (GAR transformylase)
LAVTAISKAIGVSEADVEKTMNAGKMSADQIVQLKLAEIEFQKQAQELGLNFEKLAVDDRASARSMQVATHSFVPAMLSVLVVTAWAVIQYFLLTHIIATEMREIIIRILGTLDAALMLVLSFYFGSSAGNSRKDEMLFNSVPANAK